MTIILKGLLKPKLFLIIDLLLTPVHKALEVISY